MKLRNSGMWVHIGKLFCSCFDIYCDSHFNFSDIKVLEADMLDLPFGNECFDVVIEKGTMVGIINRASSYISIQMKLLVVFN